MLTFSCNNVARNFFLDKNRLIETKSVTMFNRSCLAILLHFQHVNRETVSNVGVILDVYRHGCVNLVD